MVRIIIKGGVWKNTEDEILKAAISKYGKNQWARISSLLVRKTPKQCKARWYEWLDPSIKKTEWSKEEDEKLLHLAKLMPTQWRTIAPIVGRTATQCLERYQKLLDEAEARDNEEASGSGGLGLSGPGDEAAPSAEDIRRLRPGEIDPDPETKPARPDPIDMDEDEKEMLSEARARLANTQGKKAKRKARERALDEARRLAMLQKRRELKAAGIIMRGKKKTKGIDYNADIPYERAPAAGFYDTTDEANRTYATPVGRTMRELDRKVRPADIDADKKKRQREADAKKAGGDAKPFGDAGKEEHIRKLREAAQISKRRKLDLPAAQVGEAELEEIVKLGRVGQSARDLVAEGGNEASAGLLGEYEALERAKHARTPMVAPEEDTIMREARNARNRIAQQTPLLGDANATLYEGTGALGATPQRSVAQTPNPLLTPAHGARLGDPGATPVSVRGAGINGRAWSEAGSATPSVANQTPLRTPLRDTLGLNADDGQSVMSETPRGEKQARNALRRELQLGLKGLPAPRNDFDIVIPGEDEEGVPSTEQSAEDELLEILGEFTGEEDSSERDARIARAKEELARREFARRSQAVQRGLPRPSVLDGQQLLDALLKRPAAAASGALARAQQLVDEEMVALLLHDSIVHPAPGSNVPGGQKSFLPAVPDAALEAARALVDAELGASLGFPGARGAVLKRLTASTLEGDDEGNAGQLVAFEAALSARRADEAWNASLQAWVSRSELEPMELLRGYEDQVARARARMVQSAAAASKEEKRLGKLLGGYQAVARTQAAKLQEDTAALQEASFTHAVFERLSLQEEEAVRERTAALQAEVDRLESTYSLAQSRYADVARTAAELEHECEEMEQEVVLREAERVNESALREMEEGEGEKEDDEDDEDVGPMPPQA